MFCLVVNSLRVFFLCLCAFLWLRFPVSKVACMCWYPQIVWHWVTSTKIFVKLLTYLCMCVKRLLSRPASQLIYAICTVYFFDVTVALAFCVPLLTLCKYSPDMRLSEPLAQPLWNCSPLCSPWALQDSFRCYFLNDLMLLGHLKWKVLSSTKDYVDFSFVLTKFFEKNRKEAALWVE